MASREIKSPTTEQRLEIASKLNERFDELCREAGFEPDYEVEIMVLALYARTNADMRQTLFIGGLR